MGGQCPSNPSPAGPPQTGIATQNDYDGTLRYEQVVIHKKPSHRLTPTMRLPPVTEVSKVG